MIAVDILFDGVFAAVAAIGFGAISDPPVRAFPYIALLAAVGHALRFCLMSYAGIDIATASLCAAVVIGFGSLWLGRGIRCPMTVLYIPALLPMVPGIYAYKTVFALIMFLQSLNDPGQGLEYMQQFFLNATVSFSVIILLAAGATLPIFIFNRRAFSLTRRRRSVNKLFSYGCFLEYDRRIQRRHVARTAPAGCGRCGADPFALSASDACRACGDEGFYGRIEFLDRGCILFYLLRSARTLRYSGPVLGGHGLYLDL